ncbi:hypothetical protein E1B28_009663 [Marasmius oreades]|uniref:CipC protein n=1 Tax=Marasmius oreades TaxID=181124 RepID=A0A9P7RVR4_9AGAR|nr:uncharacterized protein E1B28_009663 [Marasmius oreades]KAG7090555.1 hypothetical protein E1B28_009663 [Marasmius oreades]
MLLFSGTPISRIKGDSIVCPFSHHFTHLTEIMGWFDNDSSQAQAYEEVTNAPHKAALSHELIAAAASYEAAKAYEDHCQTNGQPDSHARAKEIMAALAGGFVDRMVETKGLDYVDKEKVKHQASKHYEENLAGQYN